jgi:hypothetical protein
MLVITTRCGYTKLKSTVGLGAVCPRL